MKNEIRYSYRTFQTYKANNQPLDGVMAALIASIVTLALVNLFL